MNSSSSSSLLLLLWLWLLLPPASGIRLSLKEAYNFKQSLPPCFFQIDSAIYRDYLCCKSILQSKIQAWKIIWSYLFISLKIFVNCTEIVLESSESGWSKAHDGKLLLLRFWFLAFLVQDLSISITNFNCLFSILEFTVFLGTCKVFFWLWYLHSITKT